MHLIPLIQKDIHVVANVRFKFANGLLREDMGNDLALARMVDAIASVEDASFDGHKGIIEFRLERSVAVGVNDRECVRLRNGDMVGGQPNEGT